MTGQILQTKLYCPLPRSDTIARQRLYRRLDEGLSLGRKLTLVAAAAGYGKTTLVSGWLAGQTRPVAWLSLDTADNDPVRCFTHMVAAFRTIDADFGIDLMALLEASKPLAPGIVVPALLNEVIEQLPPFILVLDDYYLIEAPSVHKIMALLIEQMPPSMHLILISRTDPPLSLARLRVNGDMTEVRASELHFTSDETARFLNECMGLGLTANDVAVLEDRTEGWIAGLKLAALSLRGTPNPGEFIKAFAGNNRYVHDYLLEEVLAQQPKAVHDFLIQTSILDRLSGSLCNAVTGQSDGQNVLERLDAANLFVIPLDNQRNWYRYHQLFVDILRIRLQADYPEKIDDLHVRASKWYEAHQFLDEAIQHALSAQAWERAADLMVQAVPRLGRTEGNTLPLLDWCQQVPEEIVLSRPMLSLYYAWLLTDAAQTDVAEYWLQRIESGLGAELERFASMTATIRSQIALTQGHGAEAVAQAEQALAQMPAGEESLWRDVSVLSLVMSSLLLGDMLRAEEALGKLPPLGSRPTAGQLLAGSLGGIVLAIQGKYNAAARQFRHILEYAVLEERGNRRSSRLHPMAGLAQIGLGQILLIWNQVEEAAPLIESGLHLGEKTQNTATLTHGYEALLGLRWAQGDMPGFDEALQRAAVWEEELELHGIWLTDSVTAYYVCFKAIASQMDGLTTWLASYRARRAASVDPAQSDPSYSTLLLELAFARGLTAWAEANDDTALLEEALTVLRDLVSDRKSQGLHTIRLRAHLYLALAYQALSQQDDGISALEQAVDLAAPAAVIRPFLDEGRAMHRLLKALSHRPNPPAYTHMLLDAFAETVAPSLPAPASPSGQDSQQANQQLLDPLTERELDVLQHMAKGFTNKEIADQLYVSVGTVKSHAKHIYGKLGVGNRTEAAARARELNLA